jgi:hypothetical protein
MNRYSGIGLRCALVIFAAVVFFGALCHAADQPASSSAKGDSSSAKGDSKTDLKTIKPEEAKDYVDQEVIVEFNVVSSKEIGSGMCFLNSLADFNDPAAFTTVISSSCVSKFKEDPKTNNPESYFKSKTIRVSGKVLKYQKGKDSPVKYEIKVDDPAQIKVTAEAAADSDKK